MPRRETSVRIPLAALLGPALLVGASRASAAAGDNDPTTTSTSSMELIVITGRRASAFDFESSARALDVVDLSKERERAMDMGVLLRQTPGIIVRRAGGLGASSQLRLNGLSGRQVPLFVDGLPIELTGLPRDPASIPVDLVRRIEVYKGVVPIELGADALGGALNFATYRPRSLRGFVGVEVSSFETRRVSGEITVATPDFPAYISTRGFFDTSENNYAVDVEIPDELGRLSLERVERFHDGFQSYGVSLAAGLLDQAWASTLELRGFLSDGTKALQHGITMGRPFGEAESSEATYGLTLLYECFQIAQFFDVELLASYTQRELGFRDLAEVVYDWRGNIVAERPRPGELTNGILQTIDEDAFAARLNLSFEPAPGHALAFNLSPSWRQRSTTQRASDGADGFARAPDLLVELVGGLSYRSSWLSGRFENDAFTKIYFLDTRSEEVRVGFDVGRIEQTHLRFGAGNALVFKPLENVLARASYEYATRLPEPTELLGDGVLIAGNPRLEPEQTHNFNLSLQLVRIETPVGALDVSLWGFWREVDQLIFLEAGELLSRFNNVESVRILGVESELGLTAWEDRIRLGANLTWEEARNTSLEGGFGRFADDRVPNRPYLYGTVQLQLQEKGLFATLDEGRLWSALRYTQAYFLTWESAGARATKPRIPSQLAADVGLVYAYRFSRPEVWTLSAAFEVHNLTGADLFDFFRVQAPGRSFHFKLGVTYK